MATELSALAISVFCRNIAMMLEAGITPEESISLLLEDTRTDALHDTLEQLHRDMGEGNSFAQAIRASGAFPSYAAAMVDTGEQSGRLEQVLHSLSDAYERRDQLQRQLKSALVYPMILLLLMCGVLTLLVTLVLPVFIRVYENMAGTLAASSYHYVTFASVLSWVSLVLTGLVCLAVLLGLLAYRLPKSHASVVRLLERLPLTKGVSLQLAVSQMMDMIATFLHSGMDMDFSMQQAAAAVTHTQLKEKARAICQSMAEGESLAQAMSAQQLFDPLYSRMLLSGARSGQLDTTVSRLAQQSGESAQTQLQQLIAAIEPILTGFLTLSVGATLLSIMLPLAGMLSAIG